MWEQLCVPQSVTVRNQSIGCLEACSNRSRAIQIGTEWKRAKAWRWSSPKQWKHDSGGVNLGRGIQSIQSRVCSTKTWISSEVDLEQRRTRKKWKPNRVDVMDGCAQSMKGWTELVVKAEMRGSEERLLHPKWQDLVWAEQRPNSTVETTEAVHSDKREGMWAY